MNKKILMGGIAFWLVASGYMGLRILESYAEDAVQASLASLPAHAEEIRYSLLSNTLDVKGIDFDIPHAKSSRKGTVAHVHVKGFNRKILFVMPSMPPYNPNELPKVAESIVISDYSDSVHTGYNKVERKISRLEIKGWYQRLGMLLDARSRYGIGERFYEEMFRCRVQNISGNALEVNVTERDKEIGRFAAKEFGLLDGMKPASISNEVQPFTAYFNDVKGKAENCDFVATRLELRDLLSPAPSYFTQLEKWAESPKGNSDEATVKDAEEAWQLLRAAYAKRPPLSGIVAQGLEILPNKKSPVSIRECGFTLAFGENWSSSCFLTGLHLGEEYFPQHVRPSLKERHLSELNLDFRYAVNGQGGEMENSLDFNCAKLGKFSASVATQGDMEGLKRKLAKNELSQQDITNALLKMKLRRACLSYSDEGLASLGILTAARELHMEPKELLVLLQRECAENAKYINSFSPALAAELQRQLERPGALSVELIPAQPMGWQELSLICFLQPSRVPLKVKSSLGTKSLEEQLH